MTLQQLRIFVHVVETGKISEAARRVNLRQPTVIFHLRSLEEDAGVQLFQEGGYRRLTAPGQILLHYAKRMLHLADEADRLLEDFHSGKQAHIHIACSHLPAAHILPRVLLRFLAQHPGATLRVDTDLGERVVQAVEQREVDAGIVMGPRIEKPGLRVFAVGRDEMGVVVRRGHPLEVIDPPLTAEDLAGVPFVMHTPSSTQRAVLDHWLGERGVRLSAPIEIGSTEGIKNFVASGQLAGFLSRMAVLDECRRGDFRFLPVVDPPARFLQILYPEDRWMSGVLQELVEALKQGVS